MSASSNTNYELKITKSVAKYSLLLLMITFGIFSVANSALAIEYYNITKNDNIKDLYIMSILNIVFTLLGVIFFIGYYGYYCSSFGYNGNIGSTFPRMFGFLIIIILGIFSSIVNLKILSRLSCLCPIQNKDNKLILCYITYFTYIPIFILILILFYFYTKKINYEEFEYV